ncbi:MAG: TRAP transporter substrate-binding protein DctP, partial [Spirochaetaceae bacterium]|nr:TRAP transporter substrate-binding protein DctP [Spirochaetaceae bacterium]
MKTNKGFWFAAMGVVLLSMTTLPLFAGGAQGKTRELKLAHFGAEDSAAQTAAKQFAENVEKRTNGAVKIIIYPNNVLGGPPQILEQVLMGTLDMTLSGQDQIAKHVPLFDAVAIPFSTTGYEHMDKILDGPFKEWAKPEVEKKGAVMLSSWEWGFRQITNSK